METFSFIDYNGSSIVQGGVCIIEPINYKFLELLYGIKNNNKSTSFLFS